MPEVRENSGNALTRLSRNAVHALSAGADLAIRIGPALAVAKLAVITGSPDAAAPAAGLVAGVTSGIIDRIHLGPSSERRTGEGLRALGRSIAWCAGIGGAVALGQTPEVQLVLHSLQSRADQAVQVVQSVIPTPFPSLTPEPTMTPFPTPTLVPTVPPTPFIDAERAISDAPLCISAGVLGALFASFAILRSKIHGPRK